MIDITGLHKKFGKQEVLTDLDLKIEEEGKIYAILGPNGSGKTTLIKSILGMVIPDKGEVSVMNQQVRKSWEYRNQINYLPQIANFPPNLKVKELFAMIKDLRSGVSDEKPLIDLFGIEQFMDKKLVHLSGGTKQKVNIAIAFMFDSPIYILDEPTSGLDPIALIRLKEIIEEKKQSGKTLLITSHILSFVEEVADYIVYLLEGDIYFQGTLERLKQETGQEDIEKAIASISQLKAHA